MSTFDIWIKQSGLKVSILKFPASSWLHIFEGEYLIALGYYIFIIGATFLINFINSIRNGLRTLLLI